MTAVADVLKGQTDMPHKGELQTLTKLSMIHQVCHSETLSIITMLMSGSYILESYILCAGIYHQ